MNRGTLGCFLLLTSAALMCGCIKYTDVTFDKFMQAKPTAGDVYVLRRNVYMINDNSNYFLYDPVASNNPEPRAAEGASDRSAVLPRGTRIRYDRLIFKQSVEYNIFNAYGTVVSGKFSGTTVGMPLEEPFPIEGKVYIARFGAELFELAK